MTSPASAHRHWQRVRGCTLAALLVWALLCALAAIWPFWGFGRPHLLVWEGQFNAETRIALGGFVLLGILWAWSQDRLEAAARPDAVDP